MWIKVFVNRCRVQKMKWDLIGLICELLPQPPTHPPLSIRSEIEDSQSSPRRPESNPEVEGGVSDVYDNDCVTEIRLIRAQQLHAKETAHLREGQKQPPAKVQYMWLGKMYAVVHNGPSVILCMN